MINVENPTMAYTDVSTKNRVKESSIFQGSKNTNSYSTVHDYQIIMPHRDKWDSLIIYITMYFFIKYVINSNSKSIKNL